MIEARMHLIISMMVRYAFPLIMLAIPAPVYPQQEPPTGFGIGPQVNEITPKQFIIDHRWVYREGA